MSSLLHIVSVPRSIIVKKKNSTLKNLKMLRSIFVSELLKRKDAW